MVNCCVTALPGSYAYTCARPAAGKPERFAGAEEQPKPVESGASINGFTRFANWILRRNKRLFQAVKSNDIQALKKLLVAKADPMAVNKNRQTVLEFAIRCKNLDAVKALLEKGGKPGRDNLILAMESYRHQNPPDLLALEKLLIGKDADLEGVFDYRTPLMYACEHLFFNIARLLVEKGANTHTTGTGETTPLIELAKADQLDTVALILKAHQKDADFAGQVEQAALVAAKLNRVKTLRYLIEQFQPEARTAVLNRLILRTSMPGGNCRYTHQLEDTLNLLVQLGGTLTTQDEQGWNALHYAASCCEPSGYMAHAINVLIKKGIPVDQTAKDGTTPLMQAVKRRDLQSTTTLIMAGANPDKKDMSGKSAKDYCQELFSHALEMAGKCARIGIRPTGVDDSRRADRVLASNIRAALETPVDEK